VKGRQPLQAVDRLKSLSSLNLCYFEGTTGRSAEYSPGRLVVNLKIFFNFTQTMKPGIVSIDLPPMLGLSGYTAFGWGLGISGRYVF